MKPLRPWYVFVLLTAPLLAQSEQHPACEHPFSGLTSESPATLRSIAPTCRERSITMLFYNRAYHTEVLDDLRRLIALHTYGTSEDKVRYRQSRIFVALAEEMTRLSWQAGRRSGIASLNAAYDQTIEDVEYTVKRYSMLIGRVSSESAP